eukprot:4785079-Amphidinium_carterae.3
MTTCGCEGIVALGPPLNHEQSAAILPMLLRYVCPSVHACVEQWLAADPKPSPLSLFGVLVVESTRRQEA